MTSFQEIYLCVYLGEQILHDHVTLNPVQIFRRRIHRHVDVWQCELVYEFLDILSYEMLCYRSHKYTDVPQCECVDGYVDDWHKHILCCNTYKCTTVCYHVDVHPGELVYAHLDVIAYEMLCYRCHKYRDVPQYE